MYRYFEINEGGHNIRCKLYFQDPKTIRRMVLFCHGFGGHKDNSAAEKFAERLTSKYKGAAMITFNWPSHGDDILILHGTSDEIIPFEGVYTFAENNLIEFVSVEGADHRFRDANKMEQAIKHILEFYGL